MPRHPELQNITHTGALLVVGCDPEVPKPAIGTGVWLMPHNTRFDLTDEDMQQLPEGSVALMWSPRLTVTKGSHGGTPGWWINTEGAEGIRLALKSNGPFALIYNPDVGVA